MKYDSAVSEEAFVDDPHWLRATRWLLPLLAIAHLVFAHLYSIRTPYREGGILLHQGRAEVPDIGAPDERQHVNYVQRLVSGQGFPVFRPDDPELYESYQSHQPPLFYVLAAGWSRLLGIDDLTSQASGRTLRLLNGILGAGLVFGVFFMGWWGFGRLSVALTAAAVAALLPMNIALSGAVSNDPLLFLLCTWSLAICALGVRDGWTIRRALALGILVGLAALTKTTALGLFPIALFAMLWTKDRDWRLIALGAGTALLLALPWWIRNQTLYGDPFAIRAFNQAFVGSPQASSFLEVLGPWGYWTGFNELELGVGWWTARSFFGVFGYMDIFLPGALYRVLIAAMLVAVLLWVLAVSRSDWREYQKVHWLYGLFLLIVLLLFVRFNLQYFQAQARYLFPAIGVIAVGVGVAVAATVRSQWLIGFCAIMGLLVALNLYVLSILPEEFARRTG